MVSSGPQSATGLNKPSALIDTGGLSELLLLSLLAACASWYIFLVPYGGIGRAFSGSFAGRTSTLLLLFSPFAAVIAAATSFFMRAEGGRRFLSLAEYSAIQPYDEHLRDLFLARALKVVAGDATPVVDPGGPIIASPRIIATRKNGKHQPVIVLPALAYARLRQDPAALDAVLAHEGAHAINRDLFWFELFERFLFWTTCVVPVVVVANVISSALTDFGRGNPLLPSLLSSLLGKSSIGLLPFLATISFGISRLTQGYREACADAFAESVVGLDALERAEKLLAGGAASRPWRSMTIEKVMYGRRLAILFGLVLGSFVSYAASPFAYWQQNVSGLETRVLALIYAMMAVALPCLAAFSLTRLLFRRHPKQDANSIALLSLFTIAVALGFSLPQTIPGMLTAAPVFDDFTFIYRSDPLHLLYAMTAESFSNATCAVVAGSLFGIASIERTASLSGVMAVLVVTLGIVEPELLGADSLGFVSFLAGAILAFWALRRAWPRIKPLTRSLPAAATFTIAGLVLIMSWLGYFGPGVFAISFQAKSQREQLAGQSIEAERSAALAARFAPFNATGYLSLARLQLDTGNTEAAVESAERGLNVPFLYDWEEIFRGHVLAGEIYIKRKAAGDFERAAYHLATTREMWARNSRLPANLAVVAFYGSAVAGIYLNTDQVTNLAWVCQAVVLAGQTDGSNPAEVAKLALTDEDLAKLKISEALYDDTALSMWSRLKGGDCQTKATESLSRGKKPEEVASMLKTVIQRAAAEDKGGSPGFSRR